MASITGWNDWWPKVTAPSIASSDSSLASDSTISTPSVVPATTRSSLDCFTWSMVGFSTYCPSIMPTRAAPTGPMNGMPDSVRAAEQPIRATMSGSLSMSWDRTVAITWTSLRNPSGNSGRIGRSIRRLFSTSASDGRPSRLKNPPGILPAANAFSW